MKTSFSIWAFDGRGSSFTISRYCDNVHEGTCFQAGSRGRISSTALLNFYDENITC